MNGKIFLQNSNYLQGYDQLKKEGFISPEIFSSFLLILTQI